PKEPFPGETRVALVPSGVAPLAKAGLEVVVEAGAGAAALHADTEYEAHGARIEPERRTLLEQADIVLLVRGPGDFPEYPDSDLDGLRKGAAIIAFLDPLGQANVMRALAARGLTLFSMELMPRITRAQSMDAL